jgi:pimeloyl-ACP methyl ester carboxylesterase
MNTRVNHYINAMYGGLPPEPPGLRIALVHQLERHRGMLQVWRVGAVDTRISWLVQLQWPERREKGVVPILLSSDQCWPHCLSDTAAEAVLDRGVALASFNRLEFAHDPPSGEREGLLFDVWPDLEFGALSAWAWAMGQTVLALKQEFPLAQVSVIGHSRSGKSALLAAAVYPAIAAVVSHNSGAVGASSLLRTGEHAESLPSLVKAFPHWLGPRVQDARWQQELIADDGQALLEAIAPRGLMIIQAQSDLWANPAGARYRYEALRRIWASRADALKLLEREGVHAIGREDWAAAADFLCRLT